MKFYHVTSASKAHLVDEHGFEDARGYFMTDSEHVGVWISDRPLDCNDMGTVYDDPVAFEIEMDESLVREFEWLEEGKNYREWLVPAVLLNSASRRRVE